MSTTQTIEITFENEDDLLRSLHERTQLDTTLLTSYDRHRIWASWQKEIQGKPHEEAIVEVSLLVHEILESRFRPFCPTCGSTELTEVREATAYMKIRGADLGPVPRLVAEEDTDRPPSIFEDTETIRCDECDFETEDPDTIYSTAGLGAPEKAVNVIRPSVHASVCQLNGTELAALVHVYDADWETWGRVAGPDRDTIPLTVTADSDPDRIDRQLQIVADKVYESRTEVLESGERIKRDGDLIRLGDLFESLCWSVTAALAKLEIAQ